MQVVERSDGSRALKLNEGVAVHSVWYPNSVLTGGEWDVFLLVPPLLDKPAKRMLVIGNAGGTIARAYGQLCPDVAIDGVEIDPKVSEAGRRYLGLGDNPKLRVITDDGRPLSPGHEHSLRHHRRRCISPALHPVLPGDEGVFQLSHDGLAPGGVLALNVAAVPGDERLSSAIGSTVLAVFPQAWRWKPLRFNELVLAFDRPVEREDLLARVGDANSAVGSLVPLFRAGLESVESEADVLTDDRAPVEWLTDRMIIDFIAGAATWTRRCFRLLHEPPPRGAASQGRPSRGARACAREHDLAPRRD